MPGRVPVPVASSRVGHAGRVGQEAARVEPGRVGPEVRMPVHQVGRDRHQAAGRDVHAGHLVVGQRVALDGPRRRVEPHGLGHDRPCPRQLVGIAGFRIAIAEHRVKLCFKPLPGRRIRRKQRHGPGQRVGGRLMAGQQEGSHLVADLGVGERRAVRGAGVEQHVQQVPGRSGRGRVRAAGGRAVCWGAAYGPAACHDPANRALDPLGRVANPARQRPQRTG